MTLRPRRLRFTRILPLAVVGAMFVSCGEAPSGSNVATNPAIQGGTGGASQAPGAAGTRTVLSPLGLNIHAAPQLSAAVLGTAAQGVSLTVLDKNSQGGGWYKVQGQTLTGWIVADPSLTGAGLFTPYTSAQRMFNVLYPQDWTFAEETADVLFHPVAGSQTIVVRTGAHTSDFGPAGGSGYVGTGQQSIVVCGVTANENDYSHTGAPPPTPAPGTAGPMPLLAQVRLRLDDSHALALDFNYTAKAEFQRFADFYNSMTFPFPQCQAPESPAPSPT